MPMARPTSAHWLGIARNHPFIDGNKRTALLTAYVFLRLNGRTLTASEVETVEIMMETAAGRVTDEAFADWLRRNTVLSDT